MMLALKFYNYLTRVEGRDGLQSDLLLLHSPCTEINT